MIGTATHPPRRWPNELLDFLRGPGVGKVLVGTSYPLTGHLHAPGPTRCTRRRAPRRKLCARATPVASSPAFPNESEADRGRIPSTPIRSTRIPQYPSPRGRRTGSAPPTPSPRHRPTRRAPTGSTSARFGSASRDRKVDPQALETIIRAARTPFTDRGRVAEGGIHRRGRVDPRCRRHRRWHEFVRFDMFVDEPHYHYVDKAARRTRSSTSTPSPTVR